MRPMIATGNPPVLKQSPGHVQYIARCPGCPHDVTWTGHSYDNVSKAAPDEHECEVAA